MTNFGDRPYQSKASETIREGWALGLTAQLLVLPTGTGKTVVFAREIEHENRNNNRCLVLAHREELLQQAADKIRRVTGTWAALEKAENRASRSEPCVVGSVQTMWNQDRLNRWPKDHFGLVIIDEAHRALADGYQTILKHFKEGGARFLGVTATPDRGDKKNLGSFFQRVAFEYSMIDAVKEGYLARPSVKTVPIKINISDVAIRTGDFADEQVGDAIKPLLPQIAAALWESAKDRKILVFMPTIETSQMMAEACSKVGWNAQWIAGISQDRRSKLALFEAAPAGTLMCNAMLLTEGYDCPSIDAICVLRATKVRSLYAR